MYCPLPKNGKNDTPESRGLEAAMDGSNKKTKGFFKFFNPETSSQKMFSHFSHYSLLQKMPPEVSAYMRGKLPRTVFLRDRYKNMWEVKVGSSGNDLFFEEGWEKFIKDNCVELGDFLVIDYLDTKSLFDFKLLGHPCCDEKIGVGRPNFLVKEEVEWDPSNDSIINENNMSEDEHEFAEVEHIPEYVIRDFNLKLPSTMILRDPKGKDWEAKVKPWKDGRVVLAGGWKELCKWNLIQEEESCICEFVAEERGMGRKEISIVEGLLEGNLEKNPEKNAKLT
nr:B3 domain-containing protein At5g60140-like [Ipomoea batatas]